MSIGMQCPICGTTGVIHRDNCEMVDYKTPREIELEAENKFLKSEIDKLREGNACG